MTEQADAARLEQILRTVDFFKPVATRRSFMRRLMLVGGGAATGAAGLGHVTSAFADAAIDFVNAAVGAERIGIAFYGNTLGTGSPFSIASDVASTTLLNSAHRVYFRAAFNQESSHLAFLQSAGGSFPFTHFGFPPDTFNSAQTMLAMGMQLESIFIGAYLGAVKAAATLQNTVVAEAAAQICGIESEHRVLINDIAAITPPNDRFFEGDIGAASDQVGNPGTRSTVFAAASDAVNAMLTLGIKPSP